MLGRIKLSWESLQFKLTGNTYSDEATKYWNIHTVGGNLKSKEQLMKYLDNRSQHYPHYEDMMGLLEDYNRKIILDYGKKYESKY